MAFRWPYAQLCLCAMAVLVFHEYGLLRLLPDTDYSTFNPHRKQIILSPLLPDTSNAQPIDEVMANLCVIGPARIRKFGWLAEYIKSRGSKGIHIHHFGRGSLPKALRGYEHLLTQHNITDTTVYERTFYRVCDVVLDLITPTSIPGISGRKKRLPRSIVKAVAYKRPIVIHRKLALLYSKHITDVETHGNDVDSFVEALDRVLKRIKPAKEQTLEMHDSNVFESKFPFFEKGGLMVFYHVAKTGGTTFRNIVRKLPNVLLRRYVCEKDVDCVVAFQNTTAEIDEFSTSEYVTMTTMFLEIHGGPPGLPGLADRLRHWRDLANERGISFFAFTIVREPLSFALSYFRFFHYNCEKEWCEPRQFSSTERSLLRATIPNRQCLLLSRMSATEGRQGYETPPATAEECQNVYDIMKKELDWVGTTEDITAQTLPLVYFMLTGEDIFATSLRPHQHKTKKASLKQLKNSTIEQIQRISRYDQEIYDKVKRDFRLSQF